MPGLHVAARTSAFRFRGSDLDIREIGNRLGVASVLEGSVRRAGNRLRITAQLIDVADGYHAWSARYDREMADVFAIQDEIVEAIVHALAPALAGAARTAVKRPTENVEAYEVYLKGRHYWHQRSPATLQTAIRLFEQAIALDPSTRSRTPASQTATRSTAAPAGSPPTRRSLARGRRSSAPWPSARSSPR